MRTTQNDSTVAAMEKEKEVDAESFGVCPQCERSGTLYYAGRDEYGACDQCKLYWWLGADKHNLKIR